MTVSTITLAGITDTSGLPTFSAGDTKQYIKDNAAALGLQYWGLAQDLYVTQDAGVIASFEDVVGGGGILSQATAGRRAALTGGLVNGYAAALFDGEDDFYVSSMTFPAAPWTVLAMFRLDDGNLPSADAYVWGRYNADGQMSGLFYRKSDGALCVYHRMTLVAVASAGFDPDAAHLAVVSYDGVTMRVQVDGGAVVTGVPSTNSEPTVPLCVGTFKPAIPATNAFPGWIKSVMVFEGDLIGAHPDRLTVPLAFHNDTYALG